jgi:hypothetical protein
MPNAGRGGTAAIMNVNRTSYHHGPGQQLDTRCFHQNENQYKVDGNLMVKGTREGPLVICDQRYGKFAKKFNRFV